MPSFYFNFILLLPQYLKSLFDFAKMHIEPLIEVSTPGLAYLCLGGFIVTFSLVTLLVRDKLNVSEVLLGTVFGILMGPYGANVFNPRSWGPAEEKITLEVTRVVLCVGLFIIGIELPSKYIFKHMKGLLVMVVPTMAIGWVLIAGFIMVLFPQLDFVSCLAISATLTPTDPIISAAIVRGNFAVKYVKPEVRHLLSAESAANDGLAYPFVTVALYLTLETSKSVAFEKWFLIGCLYQVVLGVVLGSFLGLIFSFLMKLSMRRRYINTESYLTQQLALALLTMGVVSTIGSDDLLAAFAAGCAIAWDGDFKLRVEGQTFAPIIDFLLNCGCFFYIGAWLPFNEFSSETLGIEIWRLFVLLIIVILLRRIPALLALGPWIPETRDWKDSLLCGHFGPVRCNMGVGAVFVTSLALTRLPNPQDPPQNQTEVLASMIQPIVAFIVLGSIIMHGLSVVILAFIWGYKSRDQTLISELPSVSLPLASTVLPSFNDRLKDPRLEMGSVDGAPCKREMPLDEVPQSHGGTSEIDLARSEAEGSSHAVNRDSANNESE
ncbi:hypothetical protein L218DRAFT_1072685 [Marasmius fiardii PR-910]|nr:hypothetical protein L218DRAFT_1072685 [Marasmius fiardii PR-910]